MSIFSACSIKWAFLFDKVMLLCKKVRFDVRYAPKHVFTVSTLSVSVHPPNPKGGKVGGNDLFYFYMLSTYIIFAVLVCISVGGQRSG